MSATRRAFLLVGTLLFVIFLFSLSIGAISIPVESLVFGRLDQLQQSVLLNIRLPRALLAMLVGAALGISGAAMQGLFRNPLADPGLIGISSGAALAVAISIVLIGPATGFLGLYGLGLAAFVGGTITSLVILRLSKISGLFSVTHMLLAGIAINALTFAGTGVLTYLSDDQQLRAFTFWTMGSLGGALWTQVFVCASITVPAIWIFVLKSRQLNILLLGEENATYLGIDTARLKRTIIMTTALTVGAAVALSGLIGFVGLVVPHLIRLLFGANHQLLIPLSAILGAALLLLADTFARTIVSPAELPVGILTSLIGGPFFLWLLIKQTSGKL
ncbi:MAG: iron ABC transporter permease [Sneathiella sp.]|nr:iron ABC transporter permease [Sneathiella sp.]